ncbi:Putative N-acetylglucosamine kinase [Rubellimicrobium mesophilum DSM 19309]|uniref:Putative N-acetylglucosamine kinase n=1 Tax=Rubellimicrobium mesophilum DSM 19309 TaxID=442562 RepID=A0A017HVM6_9RHOB|nr:BadF/BadG/BcrA/BcrD ATPase family protein [Rubellimicrobium mesophilum]EYD78380.1 Putative N-acetylglucosamine kinase [Rubellimicrobium mesophilum DSM 19309]
MASWVAAIDGGGTKTAAALAGRRGGVSFLPEGPGCNPQDGPGWAGVLRAILTRALQAPGGVDAVVLGLPGFGEVPVHDAAVLGLLGELLKVPFEPMNDVFLAHLGGLGGGSGVLVLSGTGSMAVARGPLGMVRVGGWGDVLGDEGSAGWIGREALTLAARAMDGRAPQALPFARALCARLGPEAGGPFAPLTWLMAQPGTPRSAVASAARHVDALAEEGQGEALRLLRAAAGELALAARTAALGAGLEEGFPWTEAGGAFRSHLLRAALAETLGRPPEPPRLTTLAGGLLRAAELAGWSLDAHWAAQVDAQLRAWA